MILWHFPLPFPWLDMAPNLVADGLLVALALHATEIALGSTCTQ